MPAIVAGEMGFNGNPRLRKMGVEFAFEAIHIEEYLRCAHPETGLKYFIDKYIRVETPDGELVRFDPYPYQQRFVDASINNRFVIVKLARQAGKTTIVAAVLLWNALFNRRFKIGITANKLMQAVEIIDRIKSMIEFVPVWLQQGIRVWRAQRISFENKSSLSAAATSSSGIRGQSFAIIYMDEVAHIHPNMQRKFYNSVYPAITAGKKTKLFMTSTPNGLEMFYDIWRDSELGKNNFARIDSHWSEKPGRDEAWGDAERARLGEEGFAQEYECEFLGSSGTLINGRVLSTLTPVPPIEIVGTNITVFERPVQGNSYVITCDVSRGVLLDYQAFTVIDITSMPYKVVASYRDNKLPPEFLHEVVHDAAKYYNRAMVLIESNDVGYMVSVNLMHVSEYDNVISTTVKGKHGTRLGGGFGQNSRIGLKTNPQTRKIGCTMLKSLVERGQLVLNDKNILWELARFSKKGVKFEAEEGSHDDLVMCLVIFAWMTDQQFFKESINSDVRAAYLATAGDAWGEDDLVPFGMNDGQPDVEAVDEDGRAWTIFEN